ncbi:MAG: CoA transferase [Flavobacteriales bacterium]|nr:CoA transferase [Flavobacteriales bacterium]
MHDLRIIETAAVLAGPAVGLFFAELGAQVIKIENRRTGGDVTRRWKLPEEDPTSTVSAYFSSVNWGKEHLMMDLRDPEERIRFDALIEGADVLITNHLAADAEKLGLQRERISDLNPRLIHAHIKGFADQPERPAFDVVLQGETGYIGMTGTDPEHMAKLPIAMIDVLAAHQLKEGILIALLQRASTGKGAYVEVSLEEAALTGLVNQASNHLMTGAVARPMGTLHPNIAPYGEVFTCINGGRMLLAVGSDAQFTALCGVLDLAGTPADPRFGTNADRVRNRIALAEVLSTAIAVRERDELLDALLRAEVPAGAVHGIDTALTSPAARRMILEEMIDGKLTRRIRGNAFRIEAY